MVAFFAGYIPLQKRSALIVGRGPRTGARSAARRSDRGRPFERKSELELPGNIQAITEAPILARADGYIERRMVDIGDRVQAGQPLAEIEAPEMDEQVRQARRLCSRRRPASNQALSNSSRARPTWNSPGSQRSAMPSLATQGVVSQAGERPVSVPISVAAGRPAVAREGHRRRSAAMSRPPKRTGAPRRMQGYRVVRAPFDGVITLRNVDVGALVNAGSTLLFRIAQTGTLRTYVNVPQTHANSMRAGPAGAPERSDLPGPRFTGTVARTANALDPASRTLLVEIHVPNPRRRAVPRHVRAGRSDQRPEGPAAADSRATR